MKAITHLKKYTIEYMVKSPIRIVYNCLYTPELLEHWFADRVIIKKGVYHFFWNGSEQRAKLIGKKENEYVRYKWLDDDNDENYFEFRINVDNITNSIALFITDFVDEKDLKSAKLLWDTNVNKLLKSIGSYT